MWQYLPEGGGTVTSSTLADGAAATIKVRVNVGKGSDDKKSSAEATGGTVTPFGPPTTPSVWCQPGGPGWVDCYWNNANSGGRPTKLVRTGNANDAIEVKGEGHMPFSVGEGNSAQLCIKAVQTSSELGPRESSQQCASATAPRYARNVAGFKGGVGQCKVGSCGAAPHHKQGLRLTNWPPNSPVTCSIDWAGSPATVTVTTNGNGDWEGEPNWNYKGMSMYLVQTHTANFNERFDCH